MVEFVTIKEAIETHKGNIRGVIIKQGELKAGTGKNGDWTMKVFTLEDSSGQVDITCWNTEIGRLKVGEFFEIDSPWWKERTDKPGTWNLGLGDYCKVNKVDNPPVQTTTSPNPETTTPEPSTDEQKFPLKQKLVHDEIWAFAVSEATKVYPLGTGGGDANLTSRMILAQVFYKKNMDFYIHREEK